MTLTPRVDGPAPTPGDGTGPSRAADDGASNEPGQLATAAVDQIAAATAAVDQIAAASTIDELTAVVADYLGKRGSLNAVRAQLKDLDAEQRRLVGAQVNAARDLIEAAAARRRAELADGARRARLDADALDITELLAADRRREGHQHLVTRTRDELEDVFVSLGYVVAEGPEAEDDVHNFEALNMPHAHPARSMWDTFYLDAGAPESTLLRTHTSPVQIRLMTAQKPPIYAVMPGRCYRRDTADARHLPVFHQIEGLVVDEGISFADLAGTIQAFTEALFGPQMNSRLRPSYFPFTEPSAEFEVTCPFCNGKGCRPCSGIGWIELGGCGMVHPNVLSFCGVDPERYTGFAFGFGIDRLAMIRYGIDDLRHFLANDMRFLSQF